MDKQMIEEMARIIAFDLCPNRHVHAKWGEEAQCYSDNNFAECTKIKNVVDKLYNAGYRKIPEGVVVLERNEAIGSPSFIRGYEQGKKETAEKFAERLSEEDCSIPIKDDFIIITRKTIDEICKEFTGDKMYFQQEIKIPIKMWQTVWIVSGTLSPFEKALGCSGIEENYVDCISLEASGANDKDIVIEGKFRTAKYTTDWYDFSDIGKTVFLDVKEAEKRLKELTGDRDEKG